MGWPSILAFAVAGIASMRAAFDEGDLDEAARQGQLAGPEVIEEAMFARDRPVRLAAIAGAPISDGRLDLLAPLARAARDPDRRVAIPAADAARTIARDVARRDLPDDLAPADLAEHRAAFAQLALDRDRWIQLRIAALDTSASLDRLLDASGIGVDARTALADPDPAFRKAALAAMPMPVPASQLPLVAKVVSDDADPSVALAAAAILCADLVADPPKPIFDALGLVGMTRIRTLVALAGAPRAQIRDATRCLSASQRGR